MQPIDASDEQYARLLEADPRQPDAWRMRARIALQNQRNNDAIELLKQGLKWLPAHVALMSDLANIYLLLRDPVGARPLLEALCNLPEEYPEFTVNYARLLWIEGEYEQALKHFNAALDRNPNDQKLATRVAQAYVSLGYADKAMEFLRSRRDRGATAEMLALLALCEFDDGGIEPALSVVKAGLRIQTKHPILNYLHAVLLVLTGDSIKARAHVAQFSLAEDIHVLWDSFQYAHARGRTSDSMAWPQVYWMWRLLAHLQRAWCSSLVCITASLFGSWCGASTARCMALTVSKGCLRRGSPVNLRVATMPMAACHRCLHR